MNQHTAGGGDITDRTPLNIKPLIYQVDAGSRTMILCINVQSTGKKTPGRGGAGTHTSPADKGHTGHTDTWITRTNLSTSQDTTINVTSIPTTGSNRFTNCLKRLKKCVDHDTHATRLLDSIAPRSQGDRFDTIDQCPPGGLRRHLGSPGPGRLGGAPWRLRGRQKKPQK